MKLSRQFSIVQFILLAMIVMLNGSKLTAQAIEPGVKLIDLERYKDAKEYFETIVKNDIKSAPDAYFYLGELAIRDSQLVQANDYFQKGNAIDKEQPVNQIGLAHLKLLAKDTVEAQKIFEEVLDNTDYKDIKIILKIAYTYIHSDIKNLDKPIAWLNKAKTIKEQKKNPLIYDRLANLYLKLNNGTLARENFQIAVNYDSTFIKGDLGIADIYLKIKNYSDAESYLNAALRVDTNYSPTYLAFSEFYKTLKNYDKAANAYKKYIDLSERTTEKLEEYSTLLYLAKDYKKAIEIIQEIGKVKANDSQLNHILAYSYYALNDTSNGIPVFQKYFSLTNPKEYISTDFQYYGKLLALASKDSLAIDAYKKALKMDTSLVYLHGDIASLYLKSKKYGEASDEYALKEKTTGRKLSLREYFDWGRALMATKQFVLADSVFSKMIQLKPDLPIGYLWRARTNASIDTTSELGLSKPYYEKFIELALKSPDVTRMKNDLIEAYSYLGFYYFLKREDPAFKDTWRQNYIDNWQKVLALDPENTKAKNAMDNLKLLK